MQQEPPAAEVRIDAGPPNAGPSSATSTSAVPAEGPKSRKPANTKFKQQQLPAWQPMLTARSVLPFLVAIGFAFIPIGIALYLSASNVMEVMTEYTDCKNKQGQACANSTLIIPNCVCEVEINLEKPMGGPVFMYYAMDNFFQNHRKYVKSRDDNQLMGVFKNANTDAGYPASDCAPFAKWVNGTPGPGNVAYGIAPCGAIANSLFNDSIELKYDGPAGAKSVGLLNTDIAWNSDKTVKFKNPENIPLQQAMAQNNLISPLNWNKPLWELDPTNEKNNGLQNEDLIVWMRTAAFPSFRKLYRRVNHTDEFKENLPAGNYTLLIKYNYPVKIFDGRKYVVLSSVSWIGGRNTFLGIAYMTVGSCCMVLAIAFLIIHLQWGRKPSEVMNVTSSSHW